MDNDSTFVAPEGVYSVTEEFKNIQPPHNPTTAPILFPTKVSSVIVRFPQQKQGGGPGLAHLLGGNKEYRKEKGNSKDRDDGGSISSSEAPDDPYGGDQSTSAPAQEGTSSTTPLIGSESHTPFSQPVPHGKRKQQASRAKHNIRTTSSTFIVRLQSLEGLTKILQAKQGEVTFLFFNVAKSFSWVEVGSKSKEALVRITFLAYPTCHDVNTVTASSDRLDIIVGFATGDLIWLDVISARYTRLNKQGCITSSPCTSVRWVPGSSTLFIASHADGTIIVYDKDHNDGAFVPLDPQAPSNALSPDVVDSSASESADWNPLDTIFVTTPQWHPTPSGVGAGLGLGGRNDKEKAAKNPVSHWRVSRKSIVDFVFSPDVKYVAAISEDGYLRVIDALAEQLVDCYSSYFGALTCVAWSPDGRFILTGGQDDLLTIFSPWEQRVVARCQGHSSFVTHVAFDEMRCDGRTYRFGSVGEDNKLILWDFSSGALHRPKIGPTHHPRVSMSSTISLAFRRDRSTPNLAGSDAAPLRYHPTPSRNEVAVVQPVLIKHIEGGDLLADLSFLPRAAVTSTRNGYVKLWVRPLVSRSRRENAPKTDAQD